MMKLNKQGKIIIELDKEDEIYEIKPGLLIIIEGKKADVKDDKSISDEEKSKLLLKLYNMTYDEREIKNIKLSEKEKAILNDLIKEGKVFIAKGKGKMHIAISKSIFNDLKKQKYEKMKQEYQKQKEHVSILDVNYAILEEQEAKNVISSSPNMYLALKHFDNKVYIAKKTFFEQTSKTIRKILKKPLHYQEIASLLKIDPTAVIVTLRLMAERGEVYETQKDVFSLID
ncbi:MAG: hypothetical protein QXI89_00180 [Candidatus Anstonellales archaeon]